ncbi:hypothetical protein JW964_07610 [candidate division KSB1 bacterium]|nr:hypothetical protein [candidate division KSB1 bacterium]
MKNKLTTLCVLLFFVTLFVQVQSSFSLSINSDADSTKSSSKIAVAAVGDSANSAISTTAGRAPYYLLFDGNGIFIKFVKNPAQNLGRRASSGVVDLLLQESCKIVMAGRFGDKMQNQLKANKIQYYERVGNAKQTVQTFIKDRRSENVQK